MYLQSRKQREAERDWFLFWWRQEIWSALQPETLTLDLLHFPPTFAETTGVVHLRDMTNCLLWVTWSQLSWLPPFSGFLVFARDHWLFLPCLTAKFQNSVASNRIHLCIDVTVSWRTTWSPGLSLATRYIDCLSLFLVSPGWQASGDHWWRSRVHEWFRLTQYTFPYLSNSSSQARPGLRGCGRVTLLCTSKDKRVGCYGGHAAWTAKCVQKQSECFY